MRAGATALFVLLGCGGLAGGPGGGRRDCIDERGVHPYGSTFPAGDDCNTCTCGDEGEVGCTRAVCFTCENLPILYASAMQTARGCDPTLRVDQCSVLAASNLGCSCPTFVNDDSRLLELSTLFQDRQCMGPVFCGACPEGPVAGECTREGACADIFAPQP